ncbi:putative fungal specific transcription factor [Penicillium brasilianum]|uniref:Putative fungal specific transcription factor n=1 Tax=Penicillium brasilianum TaxID=104259 RepID=A0A1S9RRJ0_PENBI|nr:putative fungal specific transcription factor [Penicillium brasilianum]
MDYQFTKIPSGKTCDIKRPCTLCIRAGVDCQTTDQWRVVETLQNNQGTKTRSKRKRSLGTGHSDEAGIIEQPWSSSTMSLVEGAFHLNSSATPDTSLVTALPGSQNPHRSASPRPSIALSAERTPTALPATNSWLQGPQSAIADLVSLLPSRDVATLLVDTYFDRIHWFMLIFHQDDFRKTWQQMYDLPKEQLIENCPNPGFISTFLVVIAIALHYAGRHRRGLLQAHGISPVDFKERILSTTRAKILDIVSLGSLEAVQTCVLLGTYYLYHGKPELAWPVCGCGLRIAQALNLHRKLPHKGSMTPGIHRRNETRKRCWWAIYEIETFCSMSYGYPHSIKDSDCDVEFLDPSAKSVTGQSPASFSATYGCPASLLSYKYLMSKLSVLINDILTDLYGLGSLKGKSQQGRLSGASGLKSLVRKVSAHDARLRKWKAEIPAVLQLSDADDTTYTSADEMDQQIGASGPRFEAHIYQLQALALKLAYENAIILVHRPLLAYKSISSAETDMEDPNHPARDTVRLSLQSCRDAALATSNIETTPIFSLAADTYAAAFIGMHTFTAGVMLCVLISTEPLGPQPHESKMGLRRLLRMQSLLKSRSHSTLNTQGLEILERLTKLVMEKELKEMLNSSNNEPNSSLHPENSREEPVIQNPAESDQMLAIDIPIVDDDATFNYIKDPVMSQALFDFDQVLSGNSMNLPLEPLFPDLLGPGGGFAPEQGWIWGFDRLAPSSEN